MTDPGARALPSVGRLKRVDAPGGDLTNPAVTVRAG